MSVHPGADELRVRARLHQLIDGPTTHPTPAEPAPRAQARTASPRLPDWWRPKPHISPDSGVEPEPPTRPRDWLDDILDSNPAPSGPQPLPCPASKTKPAPAPEPAPKRRTRRPARTREQHTPRESLLDATARIPRRIRWLIYHATAAGAGWWLGWVDWSTSTASWFAAGHWTAPSAWVLYGLGACVCGLYRRSRTWAWPAAWAAAVPVSSVVLGVLLYAPNS